MRAGVHVLKVCCMATVKAAGHHGGWQSTQKHGLTVGVADIGQDRTVMRIWREWSLVVLWRLDGRGGKWWHGASCSRGHLRSSRHWTCAQRTRLGWRASGVREGRMLRRTRRLLRIVCRRWRWSEPFLGMNGRRLRAGSCDWGLRVHHGPLHRLL